MEYSYQDILRHLEARKKGMAGVRAATALNKAAKRNELLTLLGNVRTVDEQKKAQVPPLSVQTDPLEAIEYEMPSVLAESRARQAAKEYDDYMRSEERKRQQATAYRQKLLEQAMIPGASISDAPLGIFQLPDQKEQELRIRKDYFELEASRKKSEEITQQRMREFETWDPEDQGKLRAWIDSGETSFATAMGRTDPQAQAMARIGYMELSRKYGPEAVTRMEEMLRRYTDEQRAKFVQDAAAALPDNIGAGLMGFTAARMANMAGNFTGPIDQLLEMTRKGTGEYPAMNPYGMGQLPSIFAGALDQQISENIRDADENGEATAGKEALATLYRAGASATDSYLRAVAGGGSKNISRALIGAGSFSRGLSEYSRKGATPTEALLMATVDAGLELLTEEVSLDRLIHQASYAPGSMKEFLKNAAISGGIEVSEEELSFLGSTIAQSVFLGGKSDRNQLIGQLMEQGMDYAAAKQEADRQLLLEGAQTAIESWLSGSMMSGVAQTRAVRKAKKLGKNLNRGGITQGDTRELMEEARKAEEESDLKQLTKDVEKKTGAGAVSEYDQGRLYQTALEQGGDFVRTVQQQWEEAHALPRQTPGRTTEAKPEEGTEDPAPRAEEQPERQQPEQEQPAQQPPQEHPVQQPMQEERRESPGSRVEVGKTDFGYNSVNPENSYFTDREEGRYTVYDDGTVEAGDLFGRMNELEGWKTNGIFQLYDVTVDGKKMQGTDELPKGYYSVEAVDRRPVTRDDYGTRRVSEKGAIRLVSETYRKAKLAENAAAAKTSEVHPLQQQIMDNTARKLGYEPENRQKQQSQPEQQIRPEQTRERERIHRSLDMMSKAVGRKVKTYEKASGRNGTENGYYQNGTIHVNLKGKDTHVQVFSHELTHSVEMAEAYRDLSELIFRRIEGRGVDLQHLRSEKKRLYAGMDVKLSDSEVDSEIVAQYVADYLLTDERSILDLTRENRSLAERIRGWLDKVLSRFGNENAMEREFLRNARDLYAKALRQSDTGSGAKESDGEFDDYREWLDSQLRAGEITDEYYDEQMEFIREQEETDAMAEEGRQYSYAGKTAKTADLKALDEAEQLEKRNVDPETIRQQTGWFRGMDGKWRFEVDDSAARISSEQHTFMSLKELLKDAEILKAYPEMENMSVWFEHLKPGVNASYDPQFDAISVDYRLKGDTEAIRRAVLHELQHAIQEREGFTGGTNVTAWNRKLSDGFDSRREEHRRGAREAEEGLRKLREEDPDFYRDMMALEKMTPDLPRGEVDWDTLEPITEDPPEWQEFDRRRDELEEIYGGEKIWDFFDLIHQQERFAKMQGRTAEELYWDTAGEIEARDAAGRADLTAEERKKTPPRLGDENTVFAEGDGGAYSISETTQGEPVAVVENDILEGVDLTTWDDDKKNKAKIAAVEALLAFKDGIKMSGDTVKVNRDSRREFTRSKYTEKIKKFNESVFADKMRTSTIADDMIRVATRWRRDGKLTHERKDYKDFAHGDILIQAGQNKYKARIVIGITPTDQYVFYDVVDMRPAHFDIKEGSPSAAESITANSDITGDPSFAMLPNGGDKVKTQFSISQTDSIGKMLTDEQREFFRDSKATTRDGRLLTLYHQTENDFTVFDPRRKGAGSSDSGTPFGIFLKSSDRDIGLRGKKQMPLYANITNPMEALNREDLTRKLRNLSPEYAGILDQIRMLDEDYHEKYEAAERATFDRIAQWRKENPNARRQAVYEDPEFNNLMEAEELVLKEWESQSAQLSTKAKEAVTEALRNAGYDGVILRQDQGSFGRSTDAYIALDPEQVKNTDNEHPTTNPDIRYSISPVEDGQQAAAEPVAEQKPEEAPERMALPAKARSYLEGAERKLLADMGEKMFVPRFARRETLKPVLQEISNAYLRDGTVNQELADEFFDKAYASGIVVDSEFYDQYKEIKTHLRNTAVTISQRDRSDIPDFGDFRRRSFGALKIVNEGGLPVDVAYQELHGMAPELFPERITHPADQLQHMLEVSRSIEASEKNLQEFFGENAGAFREYARGQFRSALSDIGQELRNVRRYADEAKAKSETGETPVTYEEAMEAFRVMDGARKNYERVNAKTLLTDVDQIEVGRLLKGEILPEHLDPDKHNVRDILKVYEAKKDYDAAAKTVGRYRKHLKGQLRAQADAYLETALEWKDKKSGLAYSRETMRRNVRDIVKDRKLADAINDEYFEPVHRSEAEATRFKTEFRNRVRSLGLSGKVKKGDLVSESHAVQLVGEAMDNIAVLRKTRGRIKTRDGKTLQEWQGVIEEVFRQSPGLDQAKIEGAVEEFRKIYDELYQRMNEVRVKNGYEPVPYRQGYFPHFQAGEEGVLARFGKAMGLSTQVDTLPTTINGLTHSFRPGIQWFGNAQKRLGFNTTYDALQGFDKYIEGVANVIYHTENIQKLRALESQIRYRTSEEGIRKQVDAVLEDTRLTEDEKRMKIEEIYEKGKFTLSNFVDELSEYTNLLAGKKSRLDRTMEALMGRRMYTIMKNLESRVGANMIAGNLGSALTNFIPLTQAGAQLDRNMILKGMWDTLKSFKEDDGLTGVSSFLTNRRGSDPLVRKWTEKASAALGTPMELIDNFVSGSIVRAAYEQNLRHGMSEAEAMYQADIYAAGVMADRSKGSMPTLFESRNPVFKAFTQFQLEVNNQFSELFKDLPRGHREKGLGALAAVLLKYFLGAFLYNEVYEYFIGRRPAMDPIGLLNDTAGDWLGYELPNLVEWGVNTVKGEETSLKTEKMGIDEAVVNLGTEVAGQLPFSAGLTLLGVETDGGRIPASAAIPDLTALWKAASTEGWSPKKRWHEAQKELSKLAYVLPPFAGGQVMKTWKGVKAYLDEGSYTVNAEGEDVLQYPVFTEEANFGTLVRAALMGKSALPEAREWVESGFDGFNAKQTAVYKDMQETGEGQRRSFELIRKLEAAEKTEAKSKAQVQRELLLEADVKPEAAAVAYYGLIASDKTREFLDTAVDQGADAGELARAAMLTEIEEKSEGKRKALLRSDLKPETVAAAYYGLMATDDTRAFMETMHSQGAEMGEVSKTLMRIQGAENAAARRDAILKASLTDEEKHAIYREKISDGKEDEISQFRAAGMDFDTFLTIQNKYSEIGDKDLKVGKKATEFSHWVNGQKYTDRQKMVIKDCFRFFSMTPAAAERYDRLTGAGLSETEAYGITEKLDALVPEEGKKQVSDLQRYRAIVDSGLPESKQLKALGEVVGESLYRKTVVCNDYGISPELYLRFKETLPRFDYNGSGSYDQAELKAALDSMGESGEENPLLLLIGDPKAKTGLTKKQKAALWQSQTTAKPYRNPYDIKVGEAVYEAMNAEEAPAEKKKTAGSFSDEVMRQLMENMK